MPSPHLRFKLWAIMLAIAAAALLLAQFKAWHNASPPVATVVGSTFNFGTMPQRAKGRHTFTIRNDGPTPLRLQLCSTTTHMPGVYELVNGKRSSSLSKRAVMVVPGSNATICMEWETRDFEGSFSKGSTFFTNDPTKPYLALVVQGSVTK